MSNWWDDALWDTCSLITLDLLVQWDEGFRLRIGAPHYVPYSLSHDDLRPETAERLRTIVGAAVAPPDPLTAIGIVRRAGLGPSVAEVDRAVFVTAVHHALNVVTADKQLARALVARGRQVASVAIILKELVAGSALTTQACDSALAYLVSQQEFLLPPDGPQGWAGLRNHRFP